MVEDSDSSMHDIEKELGLRSDSDAMSEDEPDKENQPSDAVRCGAA